MAFETTKMNRNSSGLDILTPYTSTGIDVDVVTVVAAFHAESRRYRRRHVFAVPLKSTLSDCVRVLTTPMALDDRGLPSRAIDSADVTATRTRRIYRTRRTVQILEILILCRTAILLDPRMQ